MRPSDEGIDAGIVLGGQLLAGAEARRAHDLANTLTAGAALAKRHLTRSHTAATRQVTGPLQPDNSHTRCSPVVRRPHFCISPRASFSGSIQFISPSYEDVHLRTQEPGPLPEPLMVRAM